MADEQLLPQLLLDFADAPAQGGLGMRILGGAGEAAEPRRDGEIAQFAGIHRSCPSSMKAQSEICQNGMI